MKRPTVLALCLAALSCRHAATPPADAIVQPPPSAHATIEGSHADAQGPADASTAHEDSPQARRLSDLADSLAERMATLRELTVQRPIARGVMSREAVVERLRGRTRQEYPPGELDLEGAMLKRLGLIPDALDYEQTMFDLLEEQVLGFYDPDEHRLYIADWVAPAMQPPTMAHELVHALQDQHFDIARFTHHTRGHGDAQTAAMSVLEGDATAAMLDFALAPTGRTVLDLPDVSGALGGQNSAEQPRLAAAPRALRESLLFPYLAGLRLCVERMRAGGHSAVDALLARPPDSTEQVLHAEKLASREAPVNVPAEVPAPLSDQFELGYHDVLGEFGTRLMLGDAVPDARAQSGAQGWGGDRAMLLVPRGSVTRADAGVTVTDEALRGAAAVWMVTMDAGRPRDDAEAAELAAMLSTALAHRYAQAPTVTVAGALGARDVGDGRVSLVATRGRAVLFADRVPSGRAAQLVATAMPRAR